MESSARTAPRHAWIAPLAVALVAAAWLTWPGADPSAALADPDAVYQVHRVSRCLLDFPHVSSVDTYAHGGDAWHLGWPGPHALLLAIVAKIAGAPADDLDALARVLSFVPPLLGAAAAAAGVLLARACGLREAPAIVAGLLCALSGDALIAFHHGAIDHHAFTALFLPLAVLAWLRRAAVAWGGCLFVLAATTPETVLYVTLLLGVLAACEGWGAARAARRRMPRTVTFFLLPAAAVAAAWMLDRAIDPNPAPLLDMSPFRLSLFQVAWLLILGLAGAAATSLPRRGRTPAERLSALMGIVIATVTLLIFALLGTGRLGAVADRLLAAPTGIGPEDLMPARSLLAVPDTHWGTWTVVLLLALLGGIGRCLVSVQRRDPPAALTAALVLTGSVALALFELRHARSLAVLVSIALAAAGADALSALAHAARIRSRVALSALAAWLVLLVVPPFAWHAFVIRRELREPARWTRTLRPLAEWMRDELPDAGPRDATPPRAVFGPWEWGNHLDVLGRQPVLADPFSHGDGSDDVSWEAWPAESGDAFADALQRHGAKHFVTAGAAGSLYGLLGSRGEEMLRIDPQAPGGIVWLATLRRHASFRLDEAGGLIDDAGRLLPLWASPMARPFAILDGSSVHVVSVPSIRLFEVVPGSEISGQAPPATSLLSVETRIRVEGGAEAVFQRLIAVDPSGRFRFRCSIPAPWRSGTIEVTRPHVLRATSGTAMLSLTVEGVRAGVPLEIPDGTFTPQER